MLAPFLSALRTRPILYVGPKYLREIDNAVGLDLKHFITVPDRTAFAEKDKILNQILVYADTANLIGFSAGPTTKWLIWSLFPALGETHTLFDFGSVFDGYVGKPSRKYQRRDSWSDILQANLK
jgi:hypothetical protein